MNPRLSLQLHCAGFAIIRVHDGTLWQHEPSGVHLFWCSHSNSYVVMWLDEHRNTKETSFGTAVSVAVTFAILKSGS